MVVAACAAPEKREERKEKREKWRYRLTAMYLNCGFATWRSLLLKSVAVRFTVRRNARLLIAP